MIFNDYFQLLGYFIICFCFRRMQNPSFQLSDFEILQSIGQGSFSKVKLVRRYSDGKLLALKQVNMDKLGMSQKNSALNEIRLLASIQCLYVISYEGSFYSSNTNSLCLLMEYADNGDLEGVINKTAKKTRMEKGLAENFIWRTIIHILQGLKTLHDNKIVHRDIKPANVFYSKGIAKIGDLNVSSASDSQFYSTKTGTPYYTAPQIWKGQKYTNNCDIWSLGCIVYEMCALLPPFKAETFPELFVSVSRGEYEPLSKQYSDDLRTFVRMCLVIDPIQRPSATELLDSPVLIKRLTQFKDDINSSGKVDLLKPIKCPKVLRFINSLLPQCAEEQEDKTSIQGSQKNIFKKRIVLTQPSKKEASRKKIPSISKNKNLDQPISIKSAIRIKSCNKIKTNTQLKSVKLIKEPSIHQKNENESSKEIKQLKIQQSIILQPSKTVKTQKFRLRSCKRIGEKENLI